MAFLRRLFLLAGIAAALATIVASITTIIGLLNPPSQSKEANQPPLAPLQVQPVVIVQPPPVVIVQAAEPRPSISDTYDRPVAETPASTVEVKETPSEPQPKVEISVNAQPTVSTKPLLSEASLALIYAVEVGSHDRVKQWLAHGADPNAARYDGKTPLMFAAENGDHDICKTLVQYSAVASRSDLRGRTALHYAAESGHNDLVQYLLDLGIPAEIVDVEGNAAYDLAVRGGHHTCAQVIRNTVKSRIR